MRSATPSSWPRSAIADVIGATHGPARTARLLHRLYTTKEPVHMTKAIHRRDFVLGVGAGLIAAPAIVRAEGPVVIRAGALKLIHSIAPYFYDQLVPEGYKVEVLPSETPTECKNAVVTKSVDFGAFGIAAAIL